MEGRITVFPSICVDESARVKARAKYNRVVPSLKRGKVKKRIFRRLIAPLKLLLLSAVTKWLAKHSKGNISDAEYISIAAMALLPDISDTLIIDAFLSEEHDPADLLIWDQLEIDP